MHELLRSHPENLAGEQILQVLAPVRVVGENQQLRRRSQHEQNANERFLHFRPLALGPGEQQRTGKSCGGGRHLRRPAAVSQTKSVGGDDAQARDLRDRKVDEHDPAREHLLSQRNMRQHDQETRDERGP